MAEVYRAYHVSLDRFVAIKVLHAFLADDPEFKERFEKEARNIARLKHPNIVQVYDFENDSDNETYYMVMELVDGSTLKEVMTKLSQQGEVMPLYETLRIIREAASALAYAHSQKMIHRDVKPANLMLDHDNRVVLTDFGIAKIVTGVQFTASGGMVGTPAYMAPEQGLGEAGDERSDLYSLGVILYQLVTGVLPYEAETPLAIILKHLNEPIPATKALNPNLPDEVDQIIRRLLAKDPTDRYQTANAVIADLDRFAEGKPLSGSTSETEEFDTPVKPIEIPASLMPTPPDGDGMPPASGAPPRRRVPLWLWLLFSGIVGAGIFAGLQAGGGFAPLVALFASPTPTATATYTASPTITFTKEPSATFTLPPSETPTASATLTDTPTPLPSAMPSATDTPQPTATMVPTETASPIPTATLTPTMTFTTTLTPTATLTPLTLTATLRASTTPRPTNTLTPSITPTPSITLTPTLDITLTLIQATLLADFQTATINACDFNYTIVAQDPEDGTFVVTNHAYERKITLRNTGTCAWERNSALMFVSGENFNAGPRIIIQERVNVGEEKVIDFVGKTPATGGRPLTGIWELRTPGNIRIGQPLEININVFEGGT